MILGFTGTREGMTPAQREAVASFIDAHKPEQIHHGDCVGADSEFQDAAILSCKPVIAIHPSDNHGLRAHRRCNLMHAVKPPLERNHDIVNAVDHLLAAPKSHKHEQRSGTWATIRYAMRVGKPVTIVWPDGTATYNAPKYRL